MLDTRRHTIATGFAVVMAALSLAACSSGSDSKQGAPSVAMSSASSSAKSQASASGHSSASPSASSSSSAPAMSQSAAKASLIKAAKTSVVSAVAVGDGYEGASADASTMHFWHTDASGAWVKDGDLSRIQSFSNSVPESIDGAVLRGSNHAAYILQAAIGGTAGSPAAQAFVHGTSGWGGVVATADDDSAITVTSSQGAGNAWSVATFNNGALVLGTYVSGTSYSDGHNIMRSWVMNGSGFKLIKTDDPSTKSQHFTAGTWGVFTSPSGKNLCNISASELSCELSPSLIQANGGNNLAKLNSQGWTIGQGDLASDEDNSGGDWATTGGGATPGTINGARILPYGSTIRDGDYSCTSTTNGFTCSNSVAGFTVNTQSVTPHGHHNDTTQATSENYEPNS